MNTSPFNNSSDLMFTIVPLIVFLGFALVFGIVIWRAIKGGREWSNNNNSPITTISAKIIAKRTDISRSGRHMGSNSMHYGGVVRTMYFVTFETNSGDRMELKLSDKEYGLLAQGDRGMLSYQGTRYKGFQRER